MKRHLWSNPDSQWEGFQAVPYWLDFKKTCGLPIDSLLREGKAEPSTVGDVFSLLRDQKLQPDSFSLGVLEDQFVATDGRLTVTVKGSSFSRDVLKLMLKMHSEEIDPFNAVWYYVDNDHCRQDVHENYSFFVVVGDKIVRERIAFSDYPGSGFDPTIFESDDHREAIWAHDADWDEANTRRWYRRFYSETRTGQLMVLRPDNPMLFHYGRTGSDLMGALSALNHSLRSIRTLLWVLLVISVVSLIIHWR